MQFYMRYILSYFLFIYLQSNDELNDLQIQDNDNNSKIKIDNTTNDIYYFRKELNETIQKIDKNLCEIEKAKSTIKYKIKSNIESDEKIISSGFCSVNKETKFFIDYFYEFFFENIRNNNIELIEEFYPQTKNLENKLNKIVKKYNNFSDMNESILKIKIILNKIYVKVIYFNLKFSFIYKISNLISKRSDIVKEFNEFEYYFFKKFGQIETFPNKISCIKEIRKFKNEIKHIRKEKKRKCLNMINHGLKLIKKLKNKEDKCVNIESNNKSNILETQHLKKRKVNIIIGNSFFFFVFIFMVKSVFTVLKRLKRSY